MSVFSDFDWSWSGVRVKETGAEIAFNRSLAWDVLRGGHYIIREFIRRRPAALDLNIEFAPHTPRPWYLVWGVLRQAGVRVDKASKTKRKILFHFSDQTYVDPPPSPLPYINGQCRDISKSHVAQVFEDIFGYNLTIDPTKATTPFLEKGELNGAHDGRILTTPTLPQPNHVYQHLIDNRTNDGTVLDYRCPTVFGEIPLVFLKERPEDQRFDNLNTKVRITKAKACFSSEEQQQISDFCRAMHLDWGGLDILRDAQSGKIYIVDVNKTDMGPPLALPIKEKLQAIKTLGNAFREGVTKL